MNSAVSDCRFAQNLQGQAARSRPDSGLDVIPEDVLSLWQGNAPDTTQASSGVRSAPPRKTPESLWWYVMLFVLASAIAESVLASRYLGTQREED